VREALARADHDFVLVEPPSPRGRKQDARNDEPRLARFAHRMARYTSLFGSALLAVIVIGIMVNALVLQHERHPAPLFAKATPLTAILSSQETMQPAPRPTPPAASTAAAEKPTPTRAKPAEPSEEAKPAPAHGDPIAQLIKTNAPAAQPNPTAAEPSHVVLSAQKALMKLGFVIKPDGLIGTSTRQAIERFERDRGLPVHGELTAKVLHELSAQSGVAIE